MTIDEFKEKYGWDPTSSRDMHIILTYAARKATNQSEEEQAHRLALRNQLRIKFNDIKESNMMASKFSERWNDILTIMKDLNNNCQPSYYTWLKSLKIISLSNKDIFIIYSEDLRGTRGEYSDFLKEDLGVITCDQQKLQVMQKEAAENYLGLSQKINISDCMVENDEIGDMLWD